ncbi:MAG TPA: PepSY-associated TM helix domain-containing protein, partial [Gammaproteobacteria bacterium]
VRRSNEIGYVSLYFDRNDGALLEQRKHDVASVGDFVMSWVGVAHTGSFGGWPVKILWAVLGLAPPLLFVTGALMWWTRVVRRKLRSSP